MSRASIIKAYLAEVLEAKQITEDSMENVLMMFHECSNGGIDCAYRAIEIYQGLLAAGAPGKARRLLKLLREHSKDYE